MIARVLHAAVVAIVLLGAVTPAWSGGGAPISAEARAASRVHFDEAQKLFALGRFEEALAEYERAFELAPLPGLLLNIAQCHRNLGRLDAAVFGYRKYLQMVPTAPERPQVERLIEELEAEQQAREDEELRARVDASLAARPAPARARPIYTRWWFITGAAVVVTGAATAAILLGRDDYPDSDLGVVDFTR